MHTRFAFFRSIGVLFALGLVSLPLACSSAPIAPAAVVDAGVDASDRAEAGGVAAAAELNATAVDAAADAP
jgi:hypothetical protein